MSYDSSLHADNCIIKERLSFYVTAILAIIHNVSRSISQAVGLFKDQFLPAFIIFIPTATRSWLLMETPVVAAKVVIMDQRGPDVEFNNFQLQK